MTKHRSMCSLLQTELRSQKLLYARQSVQRLVKRLLSGTMSALETLHTQLEEVLRTEAVAAMAAYEAGKYQTQNSLDSCLGELRKVQATAEEQCQTKVQHMQVQYQQELELLTYQYEEQVRLLEATTKERVKAAQVEAEEVIMQAAAHLLYTLQQQQQAAAEAAALAQASMQQGWSTDDAQQFQQLQQLKHQPTPQQQLQHQQLPGLLLPVGQQQQQEAENSQQLQESPPKQQQQHQPQQHHSEQQPGQLSEHELEQHRHSWQQLEHAEPVLQQRQQQQQQQQPHISTPPRDTQAADIQEASVAAGGEQSGAWQQLAASSCTSLYATPHTRAAYDSISAPASVSASRRSSTARDSNTDAGAHWQDSHNLPSLQRIQKPPRQLLRALSATEVLRRASSSRQQLQQGLLEGLRRASEASSSPATRDSDSRNSNLWCQLTNANRTRHLRTSSSTSSRTWEMSARDEPGMGGVAQVLLLRQSKQGLVSSGRDGQQRQSRGSDTSTPWLSSSVNGRSMARVGSRDRSPVWSARKPTDALDLLEDASD